MKQSCVGGLLTMALLLAGAAGCKKSKGDVELPVVKKEPVKREALFGAVAIGERVLTSFPIEGEKAARWHYRVKLEDDVVVGYERVSPSGTVHRRAEFKRAGGLHGRFFDAYDQEVWTSTLKGGKLTEKRRSGNTSVRGCAALTSEFDALGRVTEEVCTDKDDQDIPDEDGCFKVVMKYTTAHQLAERSCLGHDDAAITDADGVHRRVFGYNDQGQRTSEGFFDAAGAPLPNGLGCATLGYEYDKAFNRIAKTCRNGAGQSVAMIGGSAVREERSFDENGCETSTVFKTAEGEPTTRAKVAEYRLKPDVFCKTLVEETRDLKGKLLSPYRGAPARRTQKWDALGLRTEKSCFNGRNKPVGCHSTGGMAQVLRYSYDERMRTVAEMGFTAAGKPARRMRDYPHLVHFRYDDEGRMLKTEFFDANDKPATALRVVHAMENQYDAFGMRAMRRNLGIDGKLVTPSTRCSILKFSRNRMHQLIKIACLDKAGKLTRSRLVYGGVSWKNASYVEILREGGHLRNVFRTAQGTIVKTLECSKEGVRCIR